jgi:hypothetical protein
VILPASLPCGKYVWEDTSPCSWLHHHLWGAAGEVCCGVFELLHVKINLPGCLHAANE